MHIYRDFFATIMVIESKNDNYCGDDKMLTCSACSLRHAGETCRPCNSTSHKELLSINSAQNWCNNIVMNRTINGSR